MYYMKNEKREIIEKFKNLKGTVNKTNFARKKKNISKSSFYKWLNTYSLPLINKPTLFDVTNIIKSEITNIELSINRVIIKIDDNYNESLLIEVVRSLRKI